MVLVLVAVWALALPAATVARPVPAHPRQAGRWITDAEGRVLVLHGFNMVYKLPPYYPAAIGFGADDAGLLQRLGFNAIRLGVIWKAVEPHPGVYDDGYLRHLATTVRTLHAHGVYSLLDFHQDMYNELFQGEGAPDWAVQTAGLPDPHNGFSANYYTNPALQYAEDRFWANARGPGGVGLQVRYAAAWRHVAKFFRSVPGVLGYEMMNEPSAGATFLSCLDPAGCPAFDAELTAFNHRVAKAIRSVDHHTLIFDEPEVSFDFGIPTHLGALADGPAVFSFHAYCLVDTPTGCPSEPKGFAAAAAHIRHTHEAIMLTEFGTNQPAELRQILDLADANMVPWTEWAYCPCNDPTGLSQDPLVLDPAEPPRGANIGPIALHSLVEPFPHAIAGTPLSWAFSPPSGTFTLRYATVRAGSRARFPARSITQIAVPRAVYANPYAVHVRGGEIVSKRGASTLDIAACPGVRTITVTVLRRGRSRSSC